MLPCVLGNRKKQIPHFQRSCFLRGGVQGPVEEGRMCRPLGRGADGKEGTPGRGRNSRWARWREVAWALTETSSKQAGARLGKQTGARLRAPLRVNGISGSPGRTLTLPDMAPIHLEQFSPGFLTLSPMLSHRHAHQPSTLVSQVDPKCTPTPLMLWGFLIISTEHGHLSYLIDILGPSPPQASSPPSCYSALRPLNPLSPCLSVPPFAEEAALCVFDTFIKK